MPQFEVMIGTDGVEKYYADTKAGAYKQAVKAHCEEGDVSFMKMTEGVITKEVLPKFKSFEFTEDYDEEGIRVAKTLAFFYIANKDPDIADIDISDFAEEDNFLDTVDIDEFLDKFFVKNKTKKIKEFKKNLFTMLRGAVFYLRFLNDPQVLFCNMKDIIEATVDMVKAETNGGEQVGGDIWVNEDLGSLELLKEKNGKLLPIPTYDRKKIASDEEYKEKFFNVFQTMAWGTFTKNDEVKKRWEEFNNANKEEEEEEEEEEDESEYEYDNLVSWIFKGKDYEVDTTNAKVYREDEDGELEFVGFRKLREVSVKDKKGKTKTKEEFYIAPPEGGWAKPKAEETVEEEDEFTSEKVSELLAKITELNEDYENERSIRIEAEDKEVEAENREDELRRENKELKKLNDDLKREMEKKDREIKGLERNYRSAYDEATEWRALTAQAEEEAKDLQSRNDKAEEFARAELRDDQQREIGKLKKEMEKFIQDRIDDEVEEGVDRVISQSELDLRDRIIDELREIIYETSFTFYRQDRLGTAGNAKKLMTDSEFYQQYELNRNYFKILKSIFGERIAEKVKSLTKIPDKYEGQKVIKNITTDDYIRGYSVDEDGNLKYVRENLTEVKNEMRVKLGDFTPEEVFINEDNERLEREIMDLEQLLLFGTKEYRRLVDDEDVVKFSNQFGFGKDKYKLDPVYGKQYVDDIARKYKGIDKKLVKDKIEGNRRDLRVIGENEYRKLVLNQSAEGAGEARVVEEAKASKEVAKLKAENDMLERQLSEARDDTDDFARNALELEEKVKELEEAVAEGQEDDRGNAYDILEVILETLGVEVESVLAEAMAMGLDKFIASEKYNDMVIEPIERGLF